MRWQPNRTASIAKSLFSTACEVVLYRARAYVQVMLKESPSSFPFPSLPFPTLSAYGLTTRRPSLAGEAARLKDCEAG